MSINYPKPKSKLNDRKEALSWIKYPKPDSKGMLVWIKPTFRDSGLILHPWVITKVI